MAKKIKSIKELVGNDLPKEIATGVTIEKLSSMFFDAKALKRQPEPLYRMDSNNHRYYYRWDGLKPIFYTSVTTLIKNTLPTSPHLIKWIADMGTEESKEFAQERADYGTFLHQECGSLLINGTYNLDTLSERLAIFLAKEKQQAKSGWESDLKKDVLAFAQFMIENDVKPLAIEICLYHPTDGYAGAIDIVCEMTVEEKGYFGEVYLSGANKGQPKESKQSKRVRAIVDIKSGRKGFFESAEIQLKAYEAMWNIHFPELPIERVFNWSPKDWRLSPTFNLKDQTDAKSAKKLPYLVELAKIENEKRNNTITVISGHIDLLKGLADNITEKSFEDLVIGNKI